MDALTLSWWVWLVAGLVLFILEAMSAGGLFLIFFGVGAVLIGLLDLTGIHLSFVMQGLIFVVFSVVSLLLFRKRLLARFQHHMPTGKVDSLVGETAKALHDIPANGIGSAELRGASWTAHNLSDAVIPQSARCRVERVDGLTLHVRGES
jgi:membrane protein implicated in regulation of membrane protease activity